jgi:hypothetical protein
MESSQEPKVNIGLLELLHILKQAINDSDAETKITSEFVLELKNRGYINNKTLGDILGKIHPEMRIPEKVTVASRMVLRSHPEEIGSNGLMWRDVRDY